jgi:hypothetical protein
MEYSELNPIEIGLARHSGLDLSNPYAILSHQKQATDDPTAKVFSLFVPRNGNSCWLTRILNLAEKARFYGINPRRWFSGCWDFFYLGLDSS